MVSAVLRGRVRAGGAIGSAGIRRQIGYGSQRGSVCDALLIAALEEGVAAVDHESRNSQQYGEHEDAQDQNLAILAPAECGDPPSQENTLAVRFVVRLPENSVMPRIVTLAG